MLFNTGEWCYFDSRFWVLQIFHSEDNIVGRTWLAIYIFAIAAALTGCGMSGSNINVSLNANANTNANLKPAEAAPANAVNSNSNVNANANANAAAKPASNGPKRISFSKGADWSSENLTLAPGESRQFVVSANEAQWLSVESSSQDIKLLMITKKNVGVESEGSSIGAALGAKGDYVFEVRNPGPKEVKTSIKVQITDEGGE